MKNRLFLVEGIPCTGKTSTAKYIADFINKSGENVLYFPEGAEDHPADYNFEAFISKENLKGFSHDEMQSIIRYSQYKMNGYVVKLSNISSELFDKVIPYKIYDMLPWKEEYPVMLDKWKNFNETAMKNVYIYVFDCCFLQNPLCETMMRFNMKDEEIFNYINDIYKSIQDLNPVVIYLKNTNIKNRIQEVSKERDKKWLDDVIEYHTSQGYGKSHGYIGFDGYIECLKARQERELAILEKLHIQKIIIENPFENWEQTHGKLVKFISRLYNYEK